MVQWGKRMEEGRTLSNTTTQDRPVCGRFAPSPSGRMHLGNLWSALLAWLAARSRGGRMVLRLEDLDPDRCTQTWCDQVMRDLEWLGLDWDNEPVYQSRRTDAYRAAFARLEEAGLLYPCYGTRAERLARSRRPAWRVRVPEEVLSFRDLLQGGVSQDLSLDCGDFILRRSDGVYAYQLAVVVDDGAMGVTQVVRGSDLLDSTPRQLWLQERLGLPHPEYGHVPLLLAPDGRRLAKRDRDQELGALQSCYSAQELVGQLALLAGLIPEYAPISPAELIPLFSWEKLPQADCAVHWADGICTFFTKTIQSPVQRDRPPV